MRLSLLSRRSWLVLCSLSFLLLLGAFSYDGGGATVRGHAGVSAGVSVVWGDSTALAAWPAAAGAAAYKVSLVRLSDNGVMEQIVVPATQRVFDAQGIWPGEAYFVAVQPLDAAGAALGQALLSAVGQNVPLDRSRYNGFLDGENVAQGALNQNLWDLRLGQDNPPNQGGAFVNAQLHYHIVAGNMDEDQTFTSMRARIPVDWSGGRTATIHGEVDLTRADFFNWFGVTLTPTAISGDHLIDFVDRSGAHDVIPQLELFADENGVHLVYAKGDGSDASELGPVYRGGYHTVNVRDDIVWKVSASHISVLIDGATAFDVALPPSQALTFSHAYLALMAENYPGNTGGAITPAPCDVQMGACTMWHLDNWGFDAPNAAASMPTPVAYYTSGCGPYPSAEKQMVTFAPCGQLDNTGGYGWDAGHGATITTTIQAPTLPGGSLIDAGVAFDAQGLGLNNQLAVAVNGGPFIAENAVVTDRNWGSWESYRVAIDPTLLRAGANSVSFRDLLPAAGATPQVANIQLEATGSAAFAPGPLPPEPAPLGVWGGGSPPGPTPSPTPSPSPSPSPIPINNAPCVVTIGGQQQTGVCSGTFTPTGGA